MPTSKTDNLIAFCDLKIKRQRNQELLKTYQLFEAQILVAQSENVFRDDDEIKQALAVFKAEIHDRLVEYRIQD